MRRLANPFVAGTTLLVLAACNGSSAIAVAPIAGAGFAAEGDVIGPGNVFSISDGRIITIADGTATLVPQDIRMRINADGQPVLQYDGETYVLRSEGNGVFAARKNGTDAVVIRIFLSDPNVAEVVYVGFDNGQEFTAGYAPIGFDTNPTEIASLSGGATFTGRAQVSARQVANDGFRSGFSSGNIRLNVDFDANLISGSLRLNEPQNNSIPIPAVTLNLEETAITGNGFTGDLSLRSGTLGPDTTLDSGSYQGRFFGQDAAAAAGTFDGTVNSGNNAPIVLQGGFVAER